MIQTQLPNGVRVVIKENNAADLVAVQCWVGVGSLDESENEQGMAHLIEHMLFKGTQKRKVGEIANTVEANGGHINAYTTFDRTVFYLTMSAQKAGLAVELLGDAVFNSAFDEGEFLREKEVVLEEIRRSLDNPSVLVSRKVFEQCFQGTGAARPILGGADYIASYQRRDVFAFYQKWYVPSNMTAVIVGNINAEHMLKEVEAVFSQASKRELPIRMHQQRALPKEAGFHLLQGDYEQARLEIAFPAPALEHPDTVALDLGSYILGVGELSRLSRRVCDEKELVFALGSSLYAPQFAGLFSISVNPRMEAIEQAIEEIAFETGRIINGEPISEADLKRARANLKADRLHQEETIDGQARALGFGLSTVHGVWFDDVFLAMVEKITAEDISRAFAKWLLPQQLVMALLPGKDGLKGDTQRMLKCWEKGFYRAVNDGAKPSKLQDIRRKFDIEHIALSSGLEVVMRHDPQAPFFNLVAVSAGGQRCEDAADAGVYSAVSQLMGMATAKQTYDQFQYMVESHGASLHGFSGKDSFGMQTQCMHEDAGLFLEEFLHCMLEPVFPKQQWQSIQRDVLERIRTQDDSPSGIAMRNFREIIFGQHPYRFPQYGLAETVAAFNESILLDKFFSARDQHRWVLGVVSRFTKDELALMLESLPRRWHPADSAFASEEKPSTVMTQTRFIEKKREQTHIVVGYPGITWSDPRRANLDVLSTVLGGQGGRLFLQLRDQQSLAYTVSPLLQFGCAPAFMGFYIACAPQKTQQALAGLDAIVLQVIEEKIAQEELVRAQNYLLGSHADHLQRGENQAMTMALMELYGLGADDFLTYQAKIQAVDAVGVQQTARSLFKQENKVTVIVGES